MISNKLFKIKSNYKMIADIEKYISRSQVIPTFDESVLSRESYGAIYKVNDHVVFGKSYENTSLTKFYTQYLSQTKIQTLIDSLDDF